MCLPPGRVGTGTCGELLFRLKGMPPLEFRLSTLLNRLKLRESEVAGWHLGGSDVPEDRTVDGFLLDWAIAVFMSLLILNTMLVMQR